MRVIFSRRNDGTNFQLRLKQQIPDFLQQTSTAYTGYHGYHGLLPQYKDMQVNW